MTRRMLPGSASVAMYMLLLVWLRTATRRRPRSVIRTHWVATLLPVGVKRITRRWWSFRTAIASARSHPFHRVPERNVPPDGAIVGSPDDHTAVRAPGCRAVSVIGRDSS